MKYFLLAAGWFLLGSGPVALAGTAAEACGALAQNLRDCKAYRCRYERQITGDSAKTVVTDYAVTGTGPDGLCGYRVQFGGEEVFSCTLSAESRGVVARIAEMQLDGSYEENKQKLIAAARTMDPDTGQMDQKALSSIDPEFIAVNNAFQSILGTECR